MGCSEKKKNEGVIVESEAKKLVALAEITLKPIFTRQEFKKHEEEEEDDENSRSTTPKSKESRVSKFKCPPAPRKRKTKPRCYYGVREFFAAPPDFESLFIRRAEKA